MARRTQQTPPPMKMVQAWDKQANETAQQYAVFTAYLLLGTKRTLEKARAWAQQTGIIGASSVRWVAEWSRRFQWVPRAQAWDTFQVTEARRRLERERLDELTRTQQRHTQLGRTLQETALLRLQAIRANPDQLAEMDPSTLLRFLTEGVRIERQGLGLDVAKVQAELHVDGSVQQEVSGTIDFSAMDEDSLRLLEQLAARMKVSGETT